MSASIDSILAAVAGWLPNTFIDFPGRPASILFFRGCNLRCPYCHNPAIVLGTNQPQPAPADLWAFLLKRKGILEGVVFSGGEPTIHGEAADLASELRGIGYAVKLDTNGLLPEAITRIKPDYLALDVKTSPRRYEGLLGARATDVAGRLDRSIAFIRDMGEQAEVRITIAPGIVDAEVIQEIARMIQGVKRAFLQPMGSGIALLDPAIATLPAVEPAQIESYRTILADYVESCVIREPGWEKHGNQRAA